MDVESTKAEEEARKRRERLKNLRNRISENQNGEDENVDEALPKFTSKPSSPKPKTPESVETEVQEQLEAAKPEPLIEEVDLTILAPRKPDWDLKRDVAKKLEILERRTQKAIAELIREKNLYMFFVR
ncbi:Coiled-coil domain-containing protein 12 [Argiope bruennichi]|uniref:Coiled-coil domain-containing protein 12 n=1 Tax=Argiope bruennichi TaxID=94029 RepID=A0A8T0E456_ARGBR|nr:Coiled-coil domain-containing protein 12 [Argiope bruennichi]